MSLTALNCLFALTVRTAYFLKQRDHKPCSFFWIEDIVWSHYPHTAPCVQQMHTTKKNAVEKESPFYWDEEIRTPAFPLYYHSPQQTIEQISKPNKQGSCPFWVQLSHSLFRHSAENWWMEIRGRREVKESGNGICALSFCFAWERKGIENQETKTKRWPQPVGWSAPFVWKGFWG